MDTGLRVQDLTFGSLFKVVFWASLVFWLFNGLILGLLALAGYDTVSFNESHIHGWGGLVIGLVIASIVGGIFAALFAVVSATVLKLLGPLLPTGTLRAKGIPNVAGSEDAAAE